MPQLLRGGPTGIEIIDDRGDKEYRVYGTEEDKSVSNELDTDIPDVIDTGADGEQDDIGGWVEDAINRIESNLGRSLDVPEIDLVADEILARMDDLAVNEAIEDVVTNWCKDAVTNRGQEYECPNCGATIDESDIEDGQATCPECGREYDVSELTANEATTNEESDMGKKETVDWLVANCDCWKGKDDRATLEKLPDDKLQVLKDKGEKDAVTNKARQPFEHEGVMFAWNAEKGAWEGTAKEKPAAPPPPTPVPAAPVAQPPTPEEWFRLAPPTVKKLVGRWQEGEQREKAALVAAMTANAASDEARAQAVAVYNALDVDQLRVMVAARPATTEQQQTPPPAPFYLGPAPTTVVANVKDDSDNVLPEMVFNFEDMASQRLRKQA